MELGNQLNEIISFTGQADRSCGRPPVIISPDLLNSSFEDSYCSFLWGFYYNVDNVEFEQGPDFLIDSCIVYLNGPNRAILPNPFNEHFGTLNVSHKHRIFFSQQDPRVEILRSSKDTFQHLIGSTQIIRTIKNSLHNCKKYQHKITQNYLQGLWTKILVAPHTCENPCQLAHQGQWASFLSNDSP